MIDDFRTPKPKPKPIANTPPPKKAKKIIYSLKAKKLLLVIIIIILAAVGGYYLYKQLSTPSPIPKSITSSVSFPIYYPSELPKGYKLNTESFNTNGRVVTYYFSNNAGQNISISQQAVPANFDFDNFNKKRILGSKEILTPVGKATIGQSSERNVASVITDKTWILVSAPSDTTAAQLETIVKSLKEAK